MDIRESRISTFWLHDPTIPDLKDTRIQSNLRKLSLVWEFSSGRGETSNGSRLKAGRMSYVLSLSSIIVFHLWNLSHNISQQHNKSWVDLSIGARQSTPHQVLWIHTTLKVMLVQVCFTPRFSTLDFTNLLVPSSLHTSIQYTWLHKSVGPSSLVWSQLGPALPFPPMTVLEV